MRSIAAALLLVSAAGCYTESEYRQDINTAHCDWYDSCGYLETLGYDTVADCVDEANRADELDQAEGIGICQDYDAGSAKSCVEGWQSLACETSEADYPAACDTVCAAAR